MSDDTVTWTARRIAEHAKKHRLKLIHIVFHGGEPLLVGPQRLDDIAQILHSGLQGVCDLDLRIHTNGLLLNQLFCKVFDSRGIKVGISLDGDKDANDRHRLFANGRSSYEKAVRAVSLLNQPRYRHLYAGILCTVDINNDPISVYNSLLSFNPPQIDFLLPHATWDNPPLGRLEIKTAYADWLLRIFNCWTLSGRPVKVRLFESIMRTAAGGVSLTEAMGLHPSDLVVIETDGTYEQADSLKTAYQGAPETGLDVFRHDLDTVASHSDIVSRQLGMEGLCDQCRTCPVVRSCGGGLYAHRYKTGSGFKNPSVYCADLMKLTSHIWENMRLESGIQGFKQPTHHIPATHFDIIAAGYGGSNAIEYLIQSQLSVNRALVGKVHALASERLASMAAKGHLAAAWNLLTQIDSRNREAVDKVLRYPYIRVWAVNCLRLLEGDITNEDHCTKLTEDLGHLNAVAVATAIYSNTNASLAVPIRRGAVHIPTLGRVVVGDAPDGATVQVSQDAFSIDTKTGRWTVPSGDYFGAEGMRVSGSSGWQPVRKLSSMDFSLCLDDVDPYRDCYGWEAMTRLTMPQVTKWAHNFANAWWLLSQDYRSYAEAMNAGLKAIMPLRKRRAHELSATARDAFGAVGVALPKESSSLALLLIHEFQHVKLGAMLDLFDLYDQNDKRLFHVPWREDARPLEGVLQGAYAHVAVTDYWRIRQGLLAGIPRTNANEQFIKFRDTTAGAIDTLEKSGSLTKLGQRLLEGMRISLSRS